MKSKIFNFFSFTILLLIFFNSQLNSQNKIWYRIYSPADSSFAKDVANSPNYSFITGKVKSDSSGWDIHTMRYSSFSGNPSGPFVYTSNFNEEPVKIISEGESFFYLTGKKKNLTDNYDILILKYSADGMLIWEREFAGSGNGDDVPVSSVYNESDRKIYIAAYSYTGLKTKNDILFLKYDTSGNMIWSKYYNYSLTGNSDDIPTGLAKNNTPGFFISGTSDDSNNVSSILTLGYDSSGTLNFANRWKDTLGGESISSGISSFQNSNIASGGYFYNGSNYDYVTISYTSAGILNWVRKFNGAGNGNDFLTDIKINNSNDVIVTGCSYSGTVRGYDYATIKYLPNGDTGWVNLFNGNGSGTDSATAMVIDGFNCVFVTGKSRDTNGKYSFGSVLYNVSGFSHWVRYFQNPIISGDNIPVAIAKYLWSNSFYLAGSTLGEIQNSYTSLFYIGFIDGIGNSNNINQKKFSLHQNYPNPFNPKTIINYQLSMFNFVSLKVYDVLGNEVTSLVNQNQNAGIFKSEFDGTNFPSGIYFYSLKIDGNVIDTKRMILLK